jgi:hypothetical protein
MADDVHINMLPDNVAKWKKLVAGIEREKDNLILVLS